MTVFDYALKKKQILKKVMFVEGMTFISAFGISIPKL